MEEIRDIIFVVVAVLFVVVDAVRKKNRRAAGKGRGAEVDNRPVEMSQESLPRKNRPSVQPAKPTVPAPAAGGGEPRQPLRKPAVAPAMQRAELVEVDADEAEAMAAEYYKTRGAYEPLAAAADTPDSRTHGAETENTDIIGNFNIRDAVLYSEILRPKFED